MKINVIGLGYIGLPTALIMAANGLDIVGTDINKDIVNKLNNGELSFEENGLENLYKKALDKKIKFSTEYIATNIYLITVPTPYDEESKKIDSIYVERAVEMVLDICNDNSIIIIESTVSPGTIDRKIRPIVSKSNKNINIVHAPERIIPGNMVYELENNSRTIGADSLEIANEIKDIYSTFCNAEIVLTDIKTAEMTKVVENTYRDINIAFANELAKICSSDKLDVYEIINIANKHPRVNILSPGPGVGGHCISVDPWFLVGDYPELTKLIKSAREVNDSMPSHVLLRVKEIMQENNISAMGKVGLYGLSYKENVDDIRESPTLQLLKVIDKDTKTQIKVYDPFVSKKSVDNQIHDFEDFIDSVDIIVIMTAHDHIKENIDKIKDKIILDTRNICSFEGVYKL